MPVRSQCDCRVAWYAHGLPLGWGFQASMHPRPKAAWCFLLRASSVRPESFSRPATSNLYLWFMSSCISTYDHWYSLLLYICVSIQNFLVIPMSLKLLYYLAISVLAHCKYLIQCNLLFSIFEWFVPISWTLVKHEEYFESTLCLHIVVIPKWDSNLEFG